MDKEESKSLHLGVRDWIILGMFAFAQIIAVLKGYMLVNDRITVLETKILNMDDLRERMTRAENILFTGPRK